MRTLVNDELDRLEAEGVLKPIQFADWAAPIVPILKSDKKSVRICGDFKQTVNRAAKLDLYISHSKNRRPLRRAIAGGKTFSKLDLSQAYQQVELDEESKAYT